MNRSVPVGDIRRLGDRALLIGVEDAGAGRRLARLLGDVVGLGECEIVGGLATVMIRLASAGGALEPLQRTVNEVVRAFDVGAGTEEERGGASDRPVVTVPCVFDGPDVAEVAAVAGGTARDVVAAVTATTLTVAVMGFSPGFAYLTGLPELLRHVPRREQPRPAVPAGSVALANGFAAIYPTASPGGWQLIGRTDQPLFSLSGPPYARLAPGDRVQFTEAAGSVAEAPPPLVAPAWSPPSKVTAVFEVVQPGLRTVLQDAGRPGVAAIGVPGAGPGDPVSFALANRLVGNRDGAVALEVTAEGPTLRGLAPSYVAVVGGRPDLTLDGQAVPASQVLPVGPGQTLEVGRVRAGLRTYVAVAGGFDGPALFGSVASDQLSGLGPGPLRAGHHLYAGAWSPPLGDHLDADVPRSRELRVVPGPQAEWFTPDALAHLAAVTFEVAADSNRVGLRLLGEGAPALRAERLATAELDSQGTVTGAVQAPPGGEPVILLPDHATLGGYPVVAVVVTADHGRLGQCAPGDEVRLVPVDQDEAQRALEQQRREMGVAVVGHYPLAVD